MKILYLGSSSVCMELENETAYYSSQKYKVTLNGEAVGEKEENVFSLFDLQPCRDYSVGIHFEDGTEEEVSFTTQSETVCVNIKEFGAAGDGINDDTAAIQSAINLLPDGTRLVFPQGTYSIRPISLRGHLTIELQKGAVLLGSTNRDQYPVIPGAAGMNEQKVPMMVFEGTEKPAYQALIQASYAEDIAIVGEGVIDGNAQNGDWWTEFKSFSVARPRLCFFNHCEKIALHGITIQNSASWQFHPCFTKNIGFYCCSVNAPAVSPNTDALDPESCENVEIIGCKFSVGDDCIAIKSGKIDLARKYRTPAKNHVIRNCLMLRGHGAVTFGSESAAGIQNVIVSQCIFHETDRGLRIKTRRGRGKDSTVTNIRFENIRMEGVLTPFVINMWYNCCDEDRHSEYVWSREALPVDDRTPHYGDFVFENIECTGVQVAGCYIDGLPESPIDSVTFDNVYMSYSADAKPGVPAMQEFAKERCRLGLYLNNVRAIRLKNVRLYGQEGKLLVADHYESLESDGDVNGRSEN